jgi:hypothetical protein
LPSRVGIEDGKYSVGLRGIELKGNSVIENRLRQRNRCEHEKN